MSASEKLKSPEFDYRDDFDVVRWAALVAVVEAAEKRRPDGTHYAQEIAAALSALEEALS